MSRKKKKTKKSADPVGSFIPAHDDDFNLKPSQVAKQQKKLKLKNQKAKKNKKKTIPPKNKKKHKKKATKSSTKPKPKKNPKKSKTKKKMKKSKTATKSKTPKTNTKKKTKKSNKVKFKNKKPKRAKTPPSKNKPPKNKKIKKVRSHTPKASTQNIKKIQLNDISHNNPQQKKKFPWENWNLEDNDDKTEETDDEPVVIYGGHRQRSRRSSLGSIRELHVKKKPRIKADDAYSGKKGGGHRSHKKKSKKHKKHRLTFDDDDGNVDIYSPRAMKKKRRKEKERQEFQVVPKHHIKRSSLPTYNSIRKNNPKLQFFVKKETQRNLATLLDQPEKRKKSKQLKNLSRNGFAIHVNKRYRLEDGRVGICKYRGRTEFGKSSEDWIGLVLEVGEGEHDGNVQGKSYFRCRMGKGVLVRPYDIIQEMGSQNRMLSKDDIKLAKAHIKRYKEMKIGTTTSADVIEKDAEGTAINPDHGYDMMQEKFYNPKSILDKNKGKKAAKKKHHTQV